ncbi:ABC transporter permease [Bacillus cereus]|uniref:ABC transporter, permease component n=1 Tax=Bacillus cereus (strain 03BB102) TaxID=572264 RepID=A0A158RND5_BACC3|nr:MULTISPECIES: ABC transporter permease [Bacillus cereus group]ACO28706.1 ABC transporter, permease component [Bacillus cereus 03BB102]AJG52530.1 ftsX-like permease family protein [Bacillus cereus 03BB102]MBL3878471.1 ABC transporter permease [Bacillus cereus]MCC2346216.1 ABC transporter permease [Bacillus anthracis]MCU4765505.1 ABC transporter permease [Bacillus cereus]
MNFRQFALNNVIRNKRLYLGHFLSSTFAVIILFTFELLTFHPNFTGNLVSTSATISALGTQGFKIAQYLIIFFSFFFILYSITTFLKARKKEFGILILHGMSNSQLKKLIFMENLLIGCSAIIVGIGTGLVFGKLILLISASIFLLEGGLPFYFPIKAILVTSSMFFILFILVSFFTVRVMKVSQVIELLKAEEKPKKEPKSSKWLAFFSILCIIIGYVSAFCLDTALNNGNAYIYVMLICVCSSVLGTYFLFTQLSFYVIKMLKKRQHTFLKRTNMLTISELTYRITDNARTLFLVSILSAVAFTSIGACLAIGNGALAEVDSPYAFEYTSLKGNKEESSHISQIEKQLHDAGFSYKLVTSTGFDTEDGSTIMNLTDYNATAKTLGYSAEILKKETDSLILASKKYLRTTSQKELKKVSSSLTIEHGNMHFNLSGNKILRDNIISPSSHISVVVSDSMYETILNTKQLAEVKADQHKVYRFLIENMHETAAVAKKLEKLIPNDYVNPYRLFMFKCSVLNWLEGKQVNAILSIISVLVGVVFFIFAISFLYFRLFTDLDRDKSQFQMLSKIGLTKRELKKTVTQQTSILFFVPILISVLHSSVAFLAIRFLAQKKQIELPVAKNSILIFTSFISVQIIYYLIIRKKYLRQILHSIK